MNSESTAKEPFEQPAPVRDWLTAGARTSFRAAKWEEFRREAAARQVQRNRRLRVSLALIAFVGSAAIVIAAVWSAGGR